jgi:hypothetical protein
MPDWFCFPAPPVLAPDPHHGGKHDDVTGYYQRKKGKKGKK